VSTPAPPFASRRSTDERSPIRFVAFGLAVVLAASVLTARLFALQVASGDDIAAELERFLREHNGSTED